MTDATKGIMAICAECLAEYRPGDPGTRVLTCSDACHKVLVDRLEKNFGKYKKVTAISTGRSYRVPVWDIIEKGVNGDTVTQYPEWAEGDESG